MSIPEGTKRQLAKWFMAEAKDQWSYRSLSSNVQCIFEVCGVDVWFELAIDGDWGIHVTMTPCEDMFRTWSVAGYEELLDEPVTFEEPTFDIPLLARVGSAATHQALGRLEQQPEFIADVERIELAASVVNGEPNPPKRL